MDIVISNKKIDYNDYGCSWKNIFSNSNVFTIAENNISYHITGKRLPVSCLIMKDTVVSKELTAFIEDDVSSGVDNYLMAVIFQRLQARRILDILDTIDKTAYDRGCADTRHNIRAILGIE